MRALWVYLLIITFVSEWACGYEAGIHKWDSAVGAFTCIVLSTIGLLLVCFLDTPPEIAAKPPEPKGGAASGGMK
jgi:hypothetical protein